MSNTLTKPWRRYRSLTGLQRELITFGLAVLFALTVLPIAIWVAGQLFLGDYLRDPGGGAMLPRQGGPMALIVDYLHGIFAGSLGHWLVLLGPYALICAFRIGRRLA